VALGTTGCTGAANGVAAAAYSTRLAPPITANDPSEQRKRRATRIRAMAFNGRQLRTIYKMDLPVLRSNPHASWHAMRLSGSADLICGHGLDVMQITAASAAGYLAPRRKRGNSRH
jgi:hypothetical protein